MRQLFKSSAMGALAATLLSSSVMGYDIVDRAKLANDKLGTLEITRPIGHDFYLNINGFVSSDTSELMDDAEKAGDIDTGDGSDDLEAVAAQLDPHFNKENILNVDLGLGFPLPSFSAFNTRVKPNFRIKGGLFAMITPMEDTVNLTTLIANLDQVPANVRSALTDCLNNAGLSDGDDMLVQCVGYGGFTQEDADFIKESYGLEKLEYQSDYVNQDVKSVALEVYAKGEAKVGLFNTYEYESNFFGDFNLYALGRADIKKRADAIMILGGGDGLDLVDNTTVNMVLDWRFGYKYENYKAFFGLEEVKIANLSEEDEASLNYGDDMLIRAHASAEYELSFVKVTPYLGSHARSGYGLGDAYYIGADWGAHVWDDRIGLNIKTQVDKEHFTLGLRTKLWFMHLDFTSKVPVSSEVDGVKIGSYYGGNIRFFF